MKNYIYENFEVSGLKIEEASPTQLRDGVLAKVKGASFFLDGYSRNGRFYPEELWENALKNSETKELIDRGLMFGCIGHPKDYSLDELLESGRVSHKVTSISIDKKSGQGNAEYEILDTPSGRILNAILRSGSNMYVSTRAFGGFSNETKEKDGKKYKVLDSKNFSIESIDFVIQPGFLETNPKLVESLSEEFSELKEKEELNHIECVDGLCGLKFSKEVEEGKGMFNRELLDGLDKSEIILMLENVISENKMITSQRELNEEKEVTQNVKSGSSVSVSTKLVMNYISYVDLLSKLMRYNIDYSKYYDSLIEFLDKDDKITISEINELGVICDEILKEEDIEESIIKICGRIKDLGDKISETPSKETEIEKGSEKEATESFVEFMLSISEAKEKEKNELAGELERSSKAGKELKLQILKMKESTKFLTKKLEEEMSKSSEVITETKNIIEYRIPEDIHTKILSKENDLKSLGEQLLKESKKVDEYTHENGELTEALNKVKKEYSSLKGSMQEKEENDKELFREILEDKQKEYNALAELREEDLNKLSDIAKVNQDLTKENSSLSDKYNEQKVKHLSVLYKLDQKEVKSVVENSKSESEVTQELSRLEKLNKFLSPAQVEIPTYTPNQKSVQKSKFLENLTR